MCALHIHAIAPLIDVQVGSSSVLVAEPELCARLEQSASAAHHTLFVPVGALWGAHDIRRLAAIDALTVCSAVFIRLGLGLRTYACRALR